MAAAGSSSAIINISKSKRSRRTKRIIAARDFLKSISFDGQQTNRYNKKYNDATNDRVGELKGGGPKSRQISTDEDILISSLPTSTKVQLHHCISVACAGNIEEDLRNQRRPSALRCDEQFNQNDDELVKVSKSKSFITSSLDLPQERRFLKKNSRIMLVEPRFFLGRPTRGLIDRRTVLVSRNAVPFRLMSVMPYRKEGKSGNTSKERRLTAQHQQNNTITIEGVEKAEGERIVSYSHLLVPASFSKKTNSEYFEGVDDAAANSAREAADVSNDTTYDPLLLDDPELTSGKHRTVLNLKSFMVSIIQYAKPSEIKKDINERFKEKFPNTHITLTKLRSIKADILEIGIKCGLEKATIACAHVYFEKLVIKEKINKVNRKYCAGACLVLAAKFMEDIKKGSLSLILETIMDKFRLSLRDLLSCELLVLIALDFSLCLPADEINPLYRRLEGSRLVSPNTGHHGNSSDKGGK